MNNRIVRKFIRNAALPKKILPFIKNHLYLSGYYYKDGSKAINPPVVKLYVNAACNAHCLMCDIGQNNKESFFYQQVVSKKEDILTAEDCRRLIDQIKIFKPQIHIHGLEPLLHKNILELISTIKKAGLYIHLITNGILLADNAKALIELNVDRITVSVDGTRQIHDLIRGDGVFDKAIEGIRLLRRWRTQLNKNHILISTHFTISNYNYSCMDEYTEMMLAAEQVDYINFLFLSFVTEEASLSHNSHFAYLGKASPVNVDLADVRNIDVDILWDQVQSIKNKYGCDQIFFNNFFSNKKTLEIFLKFPEKTISNVKCKSPWKTATILANGNVIINNRCFKYVAGNIHEQAFKEIWNGKQYRTFRTELKKAGYFPACVRCCVAYPNG